MNEEGIGQSKVATKFRFKSYDTLFVFVVRFLSNPCHRGLKEISGTVFFCELKYKNVQNDFIFSYL